MLPFFSIDIKNPISEKKSAYWRNGFEIIIMVFRSAKYIKNITQNKTKCHGKSVWYQNKKYRFIPFSKILDYLESV